MANVIPMALGFVDLLEEVTKREKEAGIRPEADVDTYMKVSVQILLINFH